MDDLLTFLPPQWATWLRVIAELSFGLSLIAAAIKPMLGEPDPTSDSRWKQIVFYVMRGIDWAAVNTKTIREKDAQRKLLAARDEQEIHEADRYRRRNRTLVEAADDGVTAALIQHIDAQAQQDLVEGLRSDLVEAQRLARRARILRMTPQERRAERADIAHAGDKGSTVLIGIALFAMLLSGSASACASSQVRSHALIADSAAEPILAAKQLIERRMAADVSDVRKRVTNPDALRLEMEALQASYAPLEGAFELLRETYNAYVDAITKTNETTGDVSHQAALALLSRWQSFLDAARDMGLTVPEPPESLRNLGGSS